MMQRAVTYITTLLVLFSFMACGNQGKKEVIEKAVERMLADYPNSTLQDIYKSFFQDRFGPGHIVADTAKAIAYLKNELSGFESSTPHYYEPTGACGNYYRVSLAAVTDGRIPFELYSSAFLRSVKEVQPTDIEEWKEEWKEIEHIIAGMGLRLPDYGNDAKAIEAMLSEGHYAVHHSKLYNKSYRPHYRIISKEIFTDEIEPLLK